MISLMFSLFLGYGYAQDLQWEGKTFTINKVKAAVADSELTLAHELMESNSETGKIAVLT